MKAAMLNGIGMAPTTPWQNDVKKPLPKLKEPIYDFNGRNKNRNRNLQARTMKGSPRQNQKSDPSVKGNE